MAGCIPFTGNTERVDDGYGGIHARHIEAIYMYLFLIFHSL